MCNNSYGFLDGWFDNEKDVAVILDLTKKTFDSYNKSQIFKVRFGNLRFF